MIKLLNLRKLYLLITRLYLSTKLVIFQINEGQAAYKMIKMQLKDLPLLLAGAIGAAITGMVAPGLSFLFGEIQKVALVQLTRKPCLLKLK